MAKWQYMGGRFLGSFLAGMLIFAGVCLAVVLGSFAPWIPKEQLGPIELFPYLYSIAILVLPNLLLSGALFFAVATATGSARRIRSLGRWSTSSAAPSRSSRCSSPRSTPATSSGASGRSISTK